MPVFDLGGRGDESGMFWEDPVIVNAGRRGKQDKFSANVAGLEGYRPPETLLSFKHLDRIGYDLETKDPNLLTKGPGTYRKDGFVVGAAIAHSTENATYYPVAHANTEKCMSDPDKFWAQLREEAREFKGELVGANLQYDLDWSKQEHGVEFPNAKFRDVQIAEPLLNENRMTYKLNRLALDYLGEGKFKDELLSLYGEDYIKHMDEVDPGHAGRYAERDTTAPLEILDMQMEGLESQGLLDLFDLESRLTPLLLQMREVGVRVDLDATERAYDQTKVEAEKAREEIKREVGFYVDVWSAESVSRAFDKLDIDYPRTENGNPSFRKPWLEGHPSKLSNLIVDQRNYEKTGSTFLNNYILEGNVNGRVHCMFNQLKSDSGGTVSGRFSSSNPNLQNIPTRHEILGPMCRSAFIPEEDHEWGCADWSQIEYRFLVHYAALAKAEGVETALRMYRENKNTDFHDLAASITGKPRKAAKNINFGVVYGMGDATMAEYLGVSLAAARVVLDEFHTELPFLKSIYEKASNRAAAVGEIKTVLGRRRRFDKWEIWTAKGGSLFSTKEAALAAKEENPALYRGRVRRAFVHKALNSLLQGSSADLMKLAMVMMYEAGLFDVLIPHLTVHDEMNVSIPLGKLGDEAFKEMVHIMETALTLQVPVLASANRGGNWDEAK